MEQMDLEDLRSMAITNPYFSNLATYIFKRRLPKCNVEFVFDAFQTDVPNNVIAATELSSSSSNDFWHNCADDPTRKTHVYIYDDSMMEIQKPCIIWTMLEHFGDAIKNLTIVNDAWDSSLEPLMELVNSRCSRTLIDLEIRFPDDAENGLFRSMTKPFEAVESVTLSVYLNLVNTSMSMDQLFPRLRKLNIDVIENIGSDYVACHFPHLESLDISTNRRNDEATEAIVEKLIELNPQIKRIDFNRPMSRRIQTVARHLTQLEHLTICNWRENDALYIPNVKTFEMRLLRSDEVTLRFEHLEELRINCYQHTCDAKWVNFLRNHPDLKQLHIEDLEHGNEFVQLYSELLPNLEEMSVSFFDRGLIESDYLVEFLMRTGKLNKFQYQNELTEEDLKSLNGSLGRQWIIKENDHGFVFDRVL